MKTKIVVLGCLFATFISSTSQAFVTKFMTSPSHPYADDSSVIVSWKTDHSLRSGYHYTGELSVTDDAHYQCRGAGVGSEGSAFASSTKRARKGSVMGLSFNSFSSPNLLGETDEGYLEWCPGNAIVIISETKNGEPSSPGGKNVGIGSFRFYSKP
jgi:hypothetical protein